MIEIVSQTGVDISKALNLDPLDLFVCENCGAEMPFIPGAGSRLICGKCGKVMDKSDFSPHIRTQKVWVSEKALRLRLERHVKDCPLNCVGHYRNAIRFRHAIFETYEKHGAITLSQAIAMLVAFRASTSRGVLRLLEKDETPLSKEFRKRYSTDRETNDTGWVWEWLATLQIKKGVGRPLRPDKLVLLLDAAVLMFCPNSYVHFIRDALRLRSHEYVIQSNRASAHGDSWDKFWKVKKRVEVSCKELWQAWFEQDPEPLPERWWARVARERGLFGSAMD
jgi:hypothetical protein